MGISIMLSGDVNAACQTVQHQPVQAHLCGALATLCEIVTHHAEP